MKTKIFYDPKLVDALSQCLKEGYEVADLITTTKLIGDKQIPDDVYNTSTMYNFVSEKIRNATTQELKNIKETYKKGWRLLFAGHRLSGGRLNDLSLYDYRRIVGVKMSTKRKRPNCD